MSESINVSYIIPADDLPNAGEASSNTKKMLNKLGINPAIVKKVAIAMYEAEINAIIHANGGKAEVNVTEDKITIRIIDTGPGIPDIQLAMQEGYSTASDSVREMGFGAGMGLPNIERYSDVLNVESTPGKGTIVTIVINI